MICPHCQANLQKSNSDGDQMLKMRGLVMRKSSLVAICPKCKGDVPLSQTVMHGIHETAVLFFKN